MSFVKAGKEKLDREEIERQAKIDKEQARRDNEESEWDAAIKKAWRYLKDGVADLGWVVKTIPAKNEWAHPTFAVCDGDKAVLNAYVTRGVYQDVGFYGEYRHYCDLTVKDTKGKVIGVGSLYSYEKESLARLTEDIGTWLVLRGHV